MRYDNIRSLFEGIDNAGIQKKTFGHIANSKITYKQLLEDINKLGNLFQSKGLNKGDRIILSSNDEYYTALFFLAFLRYGIVTILLDPEVPVKRAIGLIQKAKARGFVMEEHLFGERNITDDAGVFQLKIKKNVQKKGRLFKRLIKSKKEENKDSATTFPAILGHLSSAPTSWVSVELSDLAYVLFTSGSTSEPKGVMITHENLFAQLDTLSTVYSLDEQSSLHNILPLYHVDGIVQGPLLSLYNHATWLRPMQFDLSKIDELFHSIYKYRASHFFCVPLILSFMNKYSEGYEDSFQTEDFKYIISSAAKLESKLWNDIEREFKVPIINVYGMTETVAAGLYCAAKDHPRKIGTIGIPIDCEAKIITADGSLANESEAGVLWLKGKNIFTGYFNNPEATSEILKNGWLNTGDVAIKDEEGFYQITGRVKNMINSGGINIYPEQVSEMINMHSSVIESVCVGIKDENIGEKLVSAVVLKPGSTTDQNELFQFLRIHLKQNQIPKHIFFFDELPKGLSGKTQLKEVEQLLIDAVQKPTEITYSNHQSVIKSSAAEAFGISADRIKMEDTAQSIDGWDSMAHLIFVTALEKHFGIRFSTSEMMTMTSMKSADRLLKQKLSN